jgi:3-oxoacyl-[acyl-carrier-protein] synthase II
MGVWCALSRGVAAFERELREGRTVLRDVTRFDVTSAAYRTQKAAILSDEATLRPTVDETLIADLAVAVAQDAIQDARLDNEVSKLGVVVGTSHGGNVAFMKFLRSFLGYGGELPRHDLLLSTSATIAGQVARATGARGSCTTISTACSSGTNAIGRAFEIVRSGRMDIVLAGGADLFTELSFSGFNILGALARGPCRSLDRYRDGMTLGDGAAFVIVESERSMDARGVEAKVEIAGHAIANDAHHATSPEPLGVEAARVMTNALSVGQVKPDEVDYINLHGTGTQANDEMELRAIERVFGARAASIPISSSKPMIGHTLGAAGALEFVISALAVSRQFVPPCRHLESPIDGFEHWTYPRVGELDRPVRVALSNSFAFAGNLAAIVLRRVTNGRSN